MAPRTRPRPRSTSSTTPTAIPVYLRGERVADILETSVRTVESWRLNGIGPAYCRTGSGRVLYKLEDVIAFAEATRVSTLDQVAA